MSTLWWYLAGVATLPALFIVWLVVGSIISVASGRGILTLTTTVNGRVTERTWPR